MFGSNVTSSWANPQQNQPQQQPTGAFGQPSGFGASGTGAFGQNQQQQQQPQANPMFGNLGGTGTNTGSTGFGAFGGTNPPQAGAANPMFGGAKPTTGFGAFGGGGNTFGGGGGAFGQSTNTASGSGTMGLFGQPAATTTSAFGGGTALFGANKPATGFGTTTTTGAAQGTVPAVTGGSTNPPYSVHTEKDTANNNVTLQYQAISCMPAYSNTSHEEIRLQDYAQGRKTAGAFGTGAFGAAQPASTGLFGSTSQQGQQPSAFGGTTTNTGFGAFGTPAAATNTAAPASTGIFGAGGAFGQTQQQPQQTQGFGAFGTTPAQQPQQQQSGGIFGGGGTFGGATAKPAFSGFGGATGGNAFGGGAFGQQNQQQPQQPAGGGLFGSTTTAPATTGFGTFGNTANKSVFGGAQPSTTQPTTGFGAFGSNQQQQNQQPQTQQPSLFGGGTGLFGNTQQQPQQQQQQQQQQQGAQQPAANPLFGGQTGGTGLFGGGGLFGNTQPQQQQQPQQQTQQPAQTGAFGGGLFGAQKQPAAPTGNLFGGFGQQSTTNAQQPSIFGGLGQPNTQSTLGGGLFGANKAAPLGQSNSTGGSLFGSVNQPAGVFGASANALGAQGSLTASISQPMGADLPIFDMLPPGPRLVNLDTSQQKKKAGFFVDIPTRSPMPRLGYTPANSRLRGFAASTSTATPAGTNPFSASLALTSSKSHPLSLSRVVDNKVAGADPFTLGRTATPALGSGTRQSVKKVILDKKIEPSELFNKSGGSPGVHGGKVVFSPKLSVASRERDAQAAQNQTSGALESPTPAPRPQRTSNRFTAHGTQQPQDEEGQATAELEDGDYWVKPDLETLKQTGYDELSGFKDLVVGRAGYGDIRFLEPVDLTGLPKLGALFGEVIRFDEKECSVYPDSDEVDKPPPGSGLNVAARITLLGCWAVDKSTREPIKDEKHPSTIKHLKRLKKIPNTHFESFDIADGKWTFRVDHF